MVMVSIALGVSITSTSLDIMATECRLSGELLCMHTTSASSALPASDLERCNFTADPAAKAAAAAAGSDDDDDDGTAADVGAIAAGTTTANAPPGTFNILAPFKLTAAVAAVAGSGLILISVALGGLAGTGIGNGIGAGIGCGAVMGFALGVATTVAVGRELLLLLPGLLHLKDFVRISAPEFACA